MQDSLTVDQLIQENYEEISRYRNAAALFHLQPDTYPEVVDHLVDKMLMRNRQRYDSDQIKLLRFLQFYGLVAHGLDERETGGFSHKHSHAVASRVFEFGETSFDNGEPWYVTGAASVHDIVEDAVQKRLKLERISDKTADIEWSDLSEKLQDKYVDSAKIQREVQIKQLVRSLKEFIIKHLSADERHINDVASFGIVMDLLTKVEYLDYFTYFNRLLAVPTDKKQIELYQSFGAHFHKFETALWKKFYAIFEPVFATAMMKTSNEREMTKKKSMHDLDTLVSRIELSELSRITAQFKISGTNPALRIKLLDRTDNTHTVYSIEEGIESWSLPHQAYNIFKNLIILTTTKGHLKSRGRHFGVEIDTFPEYLHYGTLLETTISQLKRMIGEMEAKYWNVLTPKRFLYKRALEVYDNMYGFEGKTLYGETKISPWRFLIKNAVHEFDATVSRYAGRIHRLLPEPQEQNLTDGEIHEVYRDIRAFLYIAEKLKGRKAYVPYFGFKREEVIDYLSRFAIKERVK
jgi:hypothetical protein